MTCKIHSHSFDEAIEKNWPEGVKKTKQRIDIYKVLYLADEPLSAAQIYSALNEKASKEMYAFSTVYRNLLAFEKAGMIEKSVLTTEDNAVYELKKQTHRHYAVCLNCHEKFTISTCPLHEISKDLETTLPGFEVTGHHLEIYGYCSKCKKTLAH